MLALSVHCAHAIGLLMLLVSLKILLASQTTRTRAGKGFTVNSPGADKWLAAKLIMGATKKRERNRNAFGRKSLRGRRGDNFNGPPENPSGTGIARRDCWPRKLFGQLLRGAFNGRTTTFVAPAERNFGCDYKTLWSAKQTI